MSRLIDVDKAENDIVENVTTKAVSRVVAILQGQPTVKAIPIEWILKRAKLCTADYANCLDYLVEDWQTEQKYMVNGRWKFPKDGEKENGNID